MQTRSARSSSFEFDQSFLSVCFPSPSLHLSRYFWRSVIVTPLSTLSLKWNRHSTRSVSRRLYCFTENHERRTKNRALAKVTLANSTRSPFCLSTTFSLAFSITTPLLALCKLRESASIAFPHPRRKLRVAKSSISRVYNGGPRDMISAWKKSAYCFITWPASAIDVA